jgi:hypothetical protein
MSLPNTSFAQDKNKSDSVSSAWDKMEMTVPKEIDFTLKSCEVGSGTVEYTFFINNKVKDAERFEIGNISVYDDEGNQYNKITMSLGKSTSSSQWVYEELPEGVNVKVKILIKDVSKNAKLFQRINITCGTRDFSMSSNKISIKNIPIENKKE